MPRSHATSLAKLTRPRLHNAVIRHRLLNLLAACRDKHRVIWIAGPPGAGKSTLAATFVETGKYRCLWYQLDAGDADITAFFRYLLIAAREMAGRRIALPPITGEFIPDPVAFGRVVFRELFSSLRKGMVVVFDNYHELPDSAMLHIVLKEAISDIPQGSNLIVLSRGLAPVSFARHRTHGTLMEIGNDQLRLTLEEANALAISRGVERTDSVRALFDRTDGWIAGLNLLIEHARHGGQANAASTPDSLEGIFQYFAGEIFESASPEHQQTLVQAAFLPFLTAHMAERISANPHAHRILDDLHRRQMFVDRRPGEETTYHFHALFREFLLARAREIFTPTGLKQLFRRAADLLEGAGHFEAAVDLWLEANDWANARRLVEAHASEMFASARWTTLLRWMDALPKDSVTDSGWLQYWRGMASLAHDPLAAEGLLASAHESFVHQQDRKGQILACVGALRAFHSNVHGNLPDTPRWSRRLTELLKEDAQPLEPTQALDAYGMLNYALQFREPQNAFLPTCADRLCALLASDAIPVERKFFAAGMAYNYLVSAESDDKLQELTALFQTSLQRDEPVHFAELYLWNYFALYCHARGAYDQARRYTQKVGEFAERYGFRRFTVGALWWQQIEAVHAGDSARVERIRVQLVPNSDDLQNIHVSAFHAASTSVLLTKGDLPGAIRHLETWAQVSRRHGLKMVEGMGLWNLTSAHLRMGNVESAMESIRKARTILEGSALHLEEREVWMAEAVLLHLTGEQSGARDLLSKAFRGRVPELWNSRLTPNNLIERACAIALDLQIEVANVRALIHRFSMRAPDMACDTWPWPFRVRVFGHFAVERDGAPLAYGQKVPRKPLDILKILIAKGGREVGIQHFAEALWPDLDGDAANAAFHTALYRLRKLLGRDEVLDLKDGKLSLGAQLCQVDALAFQELAIQSRGQKTNALMARSIADRVFKLYVSDFLEGEPEAPWVIAARVRLERQLIEILTQLAESLKELGDFQSAVDIYRRGIGICASAEALHRGHMRCLLATGAYSEALEAYELCRTTIAGVYGAKLSVETEGLYQEIRHLAAGAPEPNTKSVR